MAIESVHPATGQVLQRFSPFHEEEIEERVARASAASRTLRRMALEERAARMLRLAHLLEEDKEDLARLMTTEMGKPLEAARTEVTKCALACRYYAAEAAQILAPISIATESSQSMVLWEPMGVVLAIMPWNFPLWQVFRFLAPALMAGNVGLLKHADNVPQCALAIESLVLQAGFPEGCLQALLVEVSQVEKLLADDRIAAATLTGSEGAGRAVAAQAGRALKKTVLELGGSDPFLVLPSADLDQAVRTGLRARCQNNGQSCIAAKRFIVHDVVYDEFITRFVDGMRAMRVGDPMLPDTDIGPLAAARLRDHLQDQVQRAIAAGATLLTGGKALPGKGFYFEPTVLADLPRSVSVYREEFFGPVALLLRAHDLEEAITIANDTPFGLGASVWTRDPAEQRRLIAELQAGSVFVNAMVASDPRLPFGGTKHSGYGRELSAEGMREFLHAKTVVIA